MENGNKQLEKLSALMIQFFEKETELPEDLLRMSDRFLFHKGSFPELRRHLEIYDTLLYLKDVMERNYLKDINDLVGYYEKKQRGIDGMFDSYKQAMAEEQLAITFQSSFETYLKINDMNKLLKSEGLYYPVFGNHNQVGYENISYRNSIEEEKSYLARIKGNQLTRQTNVSFISSKKNDKLISN
jgi:hypothetical protein